jgi:hypothetical protein
MHSFLDSIIAKSLATNCPIQSRQMKANYVFIDTLIEETKTRLYCVHSYLTCFLLAETQLHVPSHGLCKHAFLTLVVAAIL